MFGFLQVMKIKKYKLKGHEKRELFMSRRKDFMGNILAMVESSGGEFDYLGNCIAISSLDSRKRIVFI